ncbi:MAG: hypothetical protein K8T25_01340 [Planctomycetia bacterium]|nr:hypothetical protein [Planctomycetia bacterium]
MSQPKKSSEEDVRAAFIAWYADAIRENPAGLVTQAQAAEMLGLSRMAVSRLVTRGYLRAVYFPKPPDIVGVAVGHDDPTWLKILAWLGGPDDTYAFPKACYVLFADVVELWKSGEARKKCKRDWNEVMTGFLPHDEYVKTLKGIQAEKREAAEKERTERASRGGRKPSERNTEKG